MKFSELKNDCFGKVLSLQNFEGVVFFQRLVDAISIYIYIFQVQGLPPTHLAMIMGITHQPAPCY